MHPPGFPDKSRFTGIEERFSQMVLSLGLAAVVILASASGLGRQVLACASARQSLASVVDPSGPQQVHFPRQGC